MADKDKQPELTPWQQQHAEFEKKKAAEAAKKAREERRKKQPVKIESVVEKYEAAPIKTEEVKVKTPFLERFKLSGTPDERGPISEVLVKIWPFLLVTVLILLGSSYVISPLSKIASFTSEGNVHETTKQIADVTDIKTNDHIWRIIKAEPTISAKIVKAFPRVKTAKLSWSFPNKFTVKITEHSDSVYLKTGNDYKLVLSDGNILTNEQVDSQKLAALPVLEGFSEKEVKTFVLAYETLKPKIKSQISTVTKSPTKVTKDFISLEMKDGNQVRVPLSQMAEKMPYYTSVAASLTEPSVVDMEAGIYAKSKAAYQQDLDDEAQKEKEAKEKKAEADAQGSQDAEQSETSDAAAESGSTSETVSE